MKETNRGESGRTVSFADIAELQKKSAIKEGLEHVLKGIRTALAGEGELQKVMGKADHEQLSEFQSYVRGYIKAILFQPLTEEKLAEVALTISIAKLRLAEYLSEAQLEEGNPRGASLA